MRKLKETVNITIDGHPVEVEKGIPVLLAAERAGIRISHFCYYEGLTTFAGCRVCVVEIEGMRGYPTSCTTPVQEGMVVHTRTPGVVEMQRGVMSLMLMDHPDRCLTCHRQEHCGIDGICLRDAVVTYRCLTCAKNKRCEFQGTSEELEMHKYPITHYQTRSSWYGPDHKEKSIKRDNPFIELDFNECILCTRCVRACDEFRGLSCYELTYRGPQAQINTSFGLPLQDVGCDFCGACIDVCPVASILDRPSKWQGSAQRVVTTVCPHCGDGCQLNLQIKGDKILRVVPDREGPANHGQGCARGRFALGFVSDPRRLKAPLIKRDGRLAEVSWDEALDYAAERLAAFKGDGFAAIASPKVTNEENYLLQKLARVAMATNNVDHYSRWEDINTVTDLGERLGFPAMTNSLDDIADAKCLLVIGSDTAVTHPIAAWQARKAARFNGGKLIVANPRRHEMCQWADLWLQYRPGTEVALLGGMMRVILEEGLHDQGFVESRCENFEALRDSLAVFNLDQVSEITGVPSEKIREAALTYAGNGPASILYDVGLVRSGNDGDGVRALVNLALLTGNLGKWGSGINPLRAASNQQGVCDMGCLPDFLPGYQPLVSQDATARFQSEWEVELSQKPGLAWPQVVREAQAGSVKALFILGENPLLDDPHRDLIEEALAKADFLVVGDMFLTETAQLADVVLPMAAFTEEEGTFTNTERRVQRVRKALESPGEARPGWWILSELGQRLGARGFVYREPAEVMAEIARVTPIYGGISYHRLEEEGIQWPCPDGDHPGTDVLYQEGFPKGRARFTDLEHAPLEEPVDVQYPILMAAVRDLYPYHKEVLSRNGEAPKAILDDEILKLHPKDAQALGISHGDWVRVISRQTQMEAPVHITDDVPEGVACLSFPLLEQPGDILTTRAFDLLSQIPQLRLCGVRIEKASHPSPS